VLKIQQSTRKVSLWKIGSLSWKILNYPLEASSLSSVEIRNSLHLPISQSIAQVKIMRRSMKNNFFPECSRKELKNCQLK
jgi:hypothetical protein